MKLEPKRLFTKAVAVTALFCMTTQTTFAALMNLAREPLAISQVPPKIMLTVSKDQQLFKKAYNDYSDLNGDGKIETTYNHTIEYYGYFDPFKCYEYTNNRFEPKANTADKLCNGPRWSGNFLNWVSMSRMDAVRKLLYGGLRSTDETFDAKLRPSPVTVLERAYLPTDAHAWAKYYNPDPSAVGFDPSVTPPISRLTPFSTTVTTPTERNATSTAAFVIPAAAGDFNITFNAALNHVQLGDQVLLQSRVNASHFARGVIVSIAGGQFTLRIDPTGVSGAGNSTTQWRLVNLSSTGISFCNLTPGATAAADPNSRSQTNTNPPVIRVVQGNFGLWNANERWQCYWSEERNHLQNGFAGGLRSNGNRTAVSEIDASAENPIRATHGLGVGQNQGEYVVRVLVCDPKFFDPIENRERCKRYPNGNLKPTGLLQEYGDTGRFHFGLMTGSHAKNVSGGVLRKNAGTLADEVRVDSDGAFREKNFDGTFRLDPYRPRGGTRARTAEVSPPGIINTLNYMRIYGYQYTDGSYLGATGDNCTYQLTSITENNCTSWGNPMSEIFFEAVRYFAGKTASPAFTYPAANSKDNELGLPLAAFADPVNKDNYCANMNVLVFNASVSDNEEDLRDVSGGDINSSSTIGGLTDIVGNAQNENINNNRFFVGKVLGATAPGDPGFQLCTDKTVSSLGAVSGICPEGPTTGGSYYIAGIAHHAKTNHVRTDLLPLLRATDQTSLKVSTYAVQLASNTPQLEIVGGGGQRVVIQPVYRLDLSGTGGGFGGGGLVDMRYVRIDNSDARFKTGKVYVNWEDSEQGGDYDQDMWGTIEWVLDTSTNKITVTTNAVSASTANPQGFGYAISGTTRDGPHFHSGIYGFNYADPTGVRGCTNCNLVGAGGQVGPQSVTYDLGAAGAANSLKDPLWYASKYGGFKDSNANKRPDVASEFDQVNNATGLAGADGEPDNYFLVTNPLQLVNALGRALNQIGSDSSGTAVMANSTSLSTTNRIYQARFDSVDWSGQLLARTVLPDGTIDASPNPPDAGKVLNTTAPGDRLILTFDDVGTRDGVLFQPGSISANLLLELNKSPITGLPDGQGLRRLAWLRGDTSQEARNGGIFRTRSRSVMGDIVSSDPTYVGAPNTPRMERSYADFRATYYNRAPMLYVGANDGMVHGFDAVSMEEKVAYIPSKLHPHLAKLTAPTYAHRFYVDGPTEAADAVVGGNWKTVLVGGLGGGGQGIYALDVTRPQDFTTGNAANLLLWEFNDTDNADLGYTYSKPVVRQLGNGKWVVIMSGGYNNSEGDSATGSGKAVLFILSLEGPTGPSRSWVEGTDYVKINTDVGDATTPNGLAPPFVSDSNGDGKADFAYAGDLQGNLWKFDLRLQAKDPLSNLQAATRKVVLFRATDPGGAPQPITSQAEGTLHPTGRGFIVAFGTGKYLEVNDTLPSGSPPGFQVQSYYGIWDKNDNPDVSAQTRNITRVQLLDQPITESGTVRTVPAASPDWTVHLGWRMDFPRSASTGERVVFRPLLFSSRLIFTTLVPIGDACAGGGTSFLMIVNPHTGGRVSSAVIDLNRDGKLNELDLVGSGATAVYASGIQSTVGISPTPVVVRGGPTSAGGSKADKIYSTPAPYMAGQGGSVLGFTFMGGPLGITGIWIGLSPNSGRVSWREIIRN